MSYKSDYRRDLEQRARDLSTRLKDLTAEQALKALFETLYPDRACAVSSFGTESVVILHMIAQIDPDAPVVFLDTLKLFPETKEYKNELAIALGLTNVIQLEPSSPDLAADDPDGVLHAENSDLCCYIRKTLPLVRALRPYELWVTGRKRHHGGGRSDLPRVEVQDGKLKFNPLYDWSQEDIRAYVAKHDLPDHPLREQGYPSIGCIPCTERVEVIGGDPRAGRWAGEEKSECGIHIVDGKVVRTRTGAS